MKRPVLLFLFFLIKITLLGQGQYNNWHFGINSSIHFNGPSVQNNSQIISISACASISDTLGNLLFYTNSDTVWAKDNSIMPNGTGLPGSADAQQSVLIVPNPDTTKSIYYIFTIGSPAPDAPKELRYSVVDMSLNNSLGDITTKNVLLDNNVTEKLTATLNFNTTDFWVVARNLASNEYKAFAVTAAGVSNKPVISGAGQPIQNDDYSGAMKISNNGCWLASVTRGIFGDQPLVEILRFDNTSGVVFGGAASTAIPHPYGLEFSSDSKKLYVGENAQAPIHQFNLNFENERDVINSVIPVSDIYDATYDLQLAPDRKIYFVTQDSFSLGSIKSPNAYSYYCNADTAVVKGINMNSYDLPNNFNLTYKGSLSCSEQISGCVTPLDKYMPNAFTPNGDGLNDCFGVSLKLKDSLPFIDLSVYDRWGNRVFYTTDRFKCWDGTYKDLPDDIGNYVWILRERVDCGYAFKTGYVVLIR